MARREKTLEELARFKQKVDEGEERGEGRGERGERREEREVREIEVGWQR